MQSLRRPFKTTMVYEQQAYSITEHDGIRDLGSSLVRNQKSNVFRKVTQNVGQGADGPSDAAASETTELFRKG